MEKMYKIEVTVKAVFYEEAKDEEQAMKSVAEEFQYTGYDELTFDSVTEIENEKGE